LVSANLTGPPRPLVLGAQEDPQQDMSWIKSEDQLKRWEELAELRDELETGEKRQVLDFISNIGDYIAGQPEVDIDLMAVSERLAMATIHVRDYEEFQATEGQHYPGGVELGGYYEQLSRTPAVPVKKDKLSAVERQNAVHELLHAASGQLYVHNSFDGLKYGVEYLDKAVGLEKKGRIPKTDFKFKWLNEALTEWMAVKIMTKEGYDPGDLQGGYIGEQLLLQEIIQVGELSLKPFVEAYFEEPDLNAEPGKRMPKWHALQTQLHEKFGPRFLQRIETMLTDNKGDPSRLYEKDETGVTKIEEMYYEWQTLKEFYKGAQKSMVMKALS
jgi:hypothetical protein